MVVVAWRCWVIARNQIPDALLNESQAPSSGGTARNERKHVSWFCCVYMPLRPSRAHRPTTTTTDGPNSLLLTASEGNATRRTTMTMTTCAGRAPKTSRWRWLAGWLWNGSESLHARMQFGGNNNVNMFPTGIQMVRLGGNGLADSLGMCGASVSVVIPKIFKNVQCLFFLLRRTYFVNLFIF